MTFQAWHIMCFVFCSRVFDVLSTYPFTMPCLQICKSGPIAQEVGCTLFYKAEKEPKMVEFPRTEMICPWRNPYHVFSVDLHPILPLLVPFHHPVNPTRLHAMPSPCFSILCKFWLIKFPFPFTASIYNYIICW